jgi:hypothetical protein
LSRSGGPGLSDYTIADGMVGLLDDGMHKPLAGLVIEFHGLLTALLPD